MCSGMSYFLNNTESGQRELHHAFYISPHAKVPVFENNRIIFYQWGKRRAEDQRSHCPHTGWVRYDAIKDPCWQNYKPEMCLIPAIRFCEKGKLPKANWFRLPSRTYLLGLKITKPEKTFVYVVTDSLQGMYQETYPKMPLIVNSKFEPIRVNSASFPGHYKNCCSIELAIV